MVSPFFIRAARPPFDLARGDAGLATFAATGDYPRRLGEEPAAASALRMAFSSSPFLADLLMKHADEAETLFSIPPFAALDCALDTVSRLAADATNRDGLTRGLRLARRRVALIVAMADLGGAMDVRSGASALSAFAGAAVGAALEGALAEAARRGRLTFPDGAARGPLSGLTVLGMGKLGAGELNYSSDIDLILFFDEDRAPLTGAATGRETFSKVAQDLSTLLDRRTGDGYVARVDLRLRPDPASTPPAISRPAAEAYYAGQGQNWERAAMIKARPIAGDLDLGEAMLDELGPFIWRRALDFHAVRDVQSIRRQIAARAGAQTVRTAGGDVKLGRGGIREIEFTAQTQQLIWGGRDPTLRVRRTEEALAALAGADRLSWEDAEGLTERYWRLRAIEQRIQMVDDRQTQRLPEPGPAYEAFARFAGFEDGRALDAALGADLRWVAGRADAQFEDAEPLVSAKADGPLVFTGEEDDPETLATLTTLGFTRPGVVTDRIRAWHRGKIRAMRSERARQLLTELTPALLDALSDAADADSAFQRFDRFLSAQPGGIQLFSLFSAHPELLAFTARIMADAPRMADQLSSRPHLLDAILDRRFLEAAPSALGAAAALDALLAEEHVYERQLDAVRRWVAERHFHSALRLLANACDADSCAAALSDVADAVIDRIQGLTEAALVEAHGRPPGGSAAVIAMGKLGARELAFGSDLDLVYVYHAPAGPTAESDGPRRLAPGPWFNRAAQRLVSALSAQTAEGGLYEVDLRLRPHGNKGPTATPLEGFERYHDEAAWTWEAMALTRARVICGDADVRSRLDQTIRQAIARERDADALRAAVAEMRAKVAAAYPAKSLWSAKHVRGGLMDVEFIVQHAQLRHAANHPAVIQPNAGAALRALSEAGLMEEDEARFLTDAARLWRRTQAALRLCLMDGAPALDQDDLADAPDGLRHLIARAVGTDDFPSALATTRETADRVIAIFTREIGDPPDA